MREEEGAPYGTFEEGSLEPTSTTNVSGQFQQNKSNKQSIPSDGSSLSFYGTLNKFKRPMLAFSLISLLVIGVAATGYLKGGNQEVIMSSSSSASTSTISSSKSSPSNKAKTTPNLSMPSLAASVQEDEEVSITDGFVASDTTTGQPHVVFLLADDQGWADMLPTTPDLKFALPFTKQVIRKSISLTNHYAHELCTPSRAALLTGVHPIRTGLWNDVIQPDSHYGMPLKLDGRDLALMPHYFKQRGYSTSMVGKWHLGFFNKKYIPSNRGFDDFLGYLDGGVHYFSHKATTAIDSEYFLDWSGLDLTNATVGGNSSEVKCMSQYIGDYGPEVMLDRFSERLTALIQGSYTAGLPTSAEEAVAMAGGDGNAQGAVGGLEESVGHSAAAVRERLNGIVKDSIDLAMRNDQVAIRESGAYDEDEAQHRLVGKMGSALQESDLDLEALVQMSRKQAKLLQEASRNARGEAMKVEPLFYYYSSQLVHEPLDNLYDEGFSTDELKAINLLPNPERRTFAKMTIMFDRQLSLLYQLLAHNGLLHDTVFVLASDNGGCDISGGYNYPLRGKKAFYFEGGVHTHAFLHSPLASPRLHNTEYRNFFTMYDWLPTLMTIIGSPLTEEDLGFIDGVDHWSTIVSSSIGEVVPSPRTEFLVGIDYNRTAVRVGDMKLILNEKAVPWYNPDGGLEVDDDTSHVSGVIQECSTYPGAYYNFLFNITDDPHEKKNLYYSPDYAQTVTFLTERTKYYKERLNRALSTDDDDYMTDAYDAFVDCGCLCPWTDDVTDI